MPILARLGLLENRFQFISKFRVSCSPSESTIFCAVPF
jgi:hypothetical protein